MITTVEIFTDSGNHHGWHVWDDSRYVGFIDRGAGTLLGALHLNNFTQTHNLITLEVTPTEYQKALSGPKVKRNGDYLTHGHPERDTTAQPGVWFEGAHGYHNTARVIQLAWSYGMPYSDHDELLTDAYDAGTETIGLNGETVEVAGAVIDQGELQDQAEQWLNDHIAPEGHYFAWEDGEFGLWKIEDEESDSE